MRGRIVVDRETYPEEPRSVVGARSWTGCPTAAARLVLTLERWGRPAVWERLDDGSSRIVVTTPHGTVVMHPGDHLALLDVDDEIGSGEIVVLRPVPVEPTTPAPTPAQAVAEAAYQLGGRHKFDDAPFTMPDGAVVRLTATTTPLG